MPRWFRYPHLLAKAKDGDGDGMVNDGTPQQRPVGPQDVSPKKPKGGGKRLKLVTADPDAEPGTVQNPIKVKSAKKALELMAAGKHVELDPKTLAVSLDKLAAMARKAREQGTDAPNINLCLAHLKDTNIFCESNKGVPRIKMPQLKGKNIRAGSSAATKGMNDDGEVDSTDEFVTMLKGMGIEMHDEDRDAALLKATQTELVGAKVGGMMAAADAGKFDPSKGRIFISRDGFILDGHHRWAATVGLSYRRGQKLTMPVTVIDLPIQELLTATTHFTEGFGIMGAAATDSGREEKKASAPPCYGCGDEVEKKAGAGPNPKSSIKEIVGSHGHRSHGKSILWPSMYEHLRAKGMSKSKAAAVSNAAFNKKHGKGAKNMTSTRVTKLGPDAYGTISKVDEDKQLVFGWMYVCHDADGELVVDKSGDFIDEPSELEEAAYDFVLHSRVGGVNHARDDDAAVHKSTLVESIMFTPEKLEALGLPPGSTPTGWWAGWKVHDPEVWSAVKKGTYKSFSIHGSGVREAVEKKDDTMLSDEFKFAKAFSPRRSGRKLTPKEMLQRKRAAEASARKRRKGLGSEVERGMKGRYTRNTPGGYQGNPKPSVSPKKGVKTWESTGFPKGRSSYKPGKARVGQHTPQSHPKEFSTEDLVAEAKYLMRMDKQKPSTVRQLAIRKLTREVGSRRRNNL